MGLIQRFLLPRQVDFDAALLTQAELARDMVTCLLETGKSDDTKMLTAIEELAVRAREAKEHNIKELLDVFITPYDKESIYRMITQLDWVSLSVKHFRLESHVYGIHSLAEYTPVLEVVQDMAVKLVEGISMLTAKETDRLADNNRRLHDAYDEVVTQCARATAELLLQDDIKRLFRHKAMLLQLKEIAKRIHISANTLEDMAIKLY